MCFFYVVAVVLVCVVCGACGVKGAASVVKCWLCRDTFSRDCRRDRICRLPYIVRGRQVSVLLYVIFNEAFVREGDLNESPI